LIGIKKIIGCKGFLIGKVSAESHKRMNQERIASQF
jgi:hypothetical protein